MRGSPVLATRRFHSCVSVCGCNGKPSSRETTNVSSVGLIPRRNNSSACRSRCALNSSTIIGDSATVRARPVFGSLYLTVVLVCSALCTMEIEPALRSTCPHCSAAISPRLRPQSTARRTEGNRRAAYCLKQIDRLRHIIDLHLGLRGFWRFHCVTRIAVDGPIAAPPDRLSERLLKQAMNMPHSSGGQSAASAMAAFEQTSVSMRDSCGLQVFEQRIAE